MTTIQAAALQRIQERAVATMMQAVEDAHLDRELVFRSFNTQLAALKLPPRPVIFYPNLGTALKRMGEIGKVSWDTAWDAASTAAWDAFAAARNAASDAARIVVSVVSRVAALDSALDAALTAARDAARDVAWVAAFAAAKNVVRPASSFAAWGAAWDTSPSSTPPPEDHASMITAGSFLEILRGGAFWFWTAPDAVHVVLAQIHTQKTHRVIEIQGIQHTIERLHREDGPAIQYEDGSGFYFWKGILVPEQLILRPDEMRVQDILAERNAEVRRAMMERYGQDRFVLDADAKVLDEWKGNELRAIDLPEDPDRRLVALKLRCPSTAAVYILRVPPDQTTVQGALAWSFALDLPGQYLLQQES